MQPNFPENFQNRFGPRVGRGNRRKGAALSRLHCPLIRGVGDAKVIREPFNDSWVPARARHRLRQRPGQPAQPDAVVAGRRQPEHRYGLRPYRYPRQRYSTVVARAPESFITKTLWPEYLEIFRALEEYLNEATERIIREEVFGDAEEAEERPDASPGSAATLGSSFAGES